MPVVSLVTICVVVGTAGFSHRRVVAVDEWRRLCEISGASVQCHSSAISGESVWEVGWLQSLGLESQQHYWWKEVQGVPRQAWFRSFIGECDGTLVHDSSDGRQSKRMGWAYYACSTMKWRIYWDLSVWMWKSLCVPILAPTRWEILSLENSERWSRFLLLESLEYPILIFLGLFVWMEMKFD